MLKDGAKLSLVWFLRLPLIVWVLSLGVVVFGNVLILVHFHILGDPIVAFSATWTFLPELKKTQSSKNLANPLIKKFHILVVKSITIILYPLPPVCM